MKRALRALTAAAVCAAAFQVQAFVRKTTSPTTSVPQVHDLWWRSRKITYFLNTSAYHGNCADAAAVTAALNASFPTWGAATRQGESAACTDFAYVACGETTRSEIGYVDTDVDRANNINLVVFRTGFCSAVSDAICHPVDDPTDLDACVDKYNCWSHDSGGGGGGILALTTSSYRVTTGELVDADIELHGWDGVAGASGTGFYFTCADPPASACVGQYTGSNCIGYDLQNTITHEAGHVLGLDHSNANGGAATMAPSAAIGETSKRDLDPDDVEGVCTIYPVGADTNADPTLAPPTVAVSAPMTCITPVALGAVPPKTGCGSTGEGGVLALIAVTVGLWRRRHSSLACQ